MPSPPLRNYNLNRDNLGEMNAFGSSPDSLAICIFCRGNIITIYFICLEKLKRKMKFWRCPTPCPLSKLLFEASIKMQKNPNLSKAFRFPLSLFSQTFLQQCVNQCKDLCTDLFCTKTERLLLVSASADWNPNCCHSHSWRQKCLVFWLVKWLCE